MRRILFITLFLSIRIAYALDGGCYKFEKPPRQTLHELIPLSSLKDNVTSGTMKDEVSWAAARGIVKKPIKDVYAMLLDHRTVKDMTKTTLKTAEIERKGYLAFHRVQIKVRVVAFLTISWEEEWGYQLLEGQSAHPKKILISYQKVAGTDHIKHQCGSFFLQEKDSKSTDTFLYEEVKASHRDHEDTARMLKGILETLRGRGAS